MNEFELIQQFFSTQSIQRSDVLLGIGDDAALVQPPHNHELVITTDTLISGVHFLENTAAADIGYKALAVNLSDLAAMGATPAWVTLALTLSNADEKWLQEFARGFFSLCAEHQTQLIGGDVTRGHLSITVQAIGFVPAHQAIKRSGAKPTDLIYVTNTLGDAALALAFLQNKIKVSATHQKTILAKLCRPTPQIAIGMALRNIATAAIDISDGLAADLNHILTRSQVGAHVDVDRIPLSTALTDSMNKPDAISLALQGGDDYELCFTVPQNKKHLVPAHCTCIGEIMSGNEYNLPLQGYQHFS